jgi:hypothetical protein
MPFDASGFWVKRGVTDILQAIKDALRAKLGPNFDLTDGSPALKWLQAWGAMPLAEVENDMDDIVREGRWADSRNPWDISFMFPRKAAARATGDVGISFKTVQSSPDPYFASGTLTFIDTADRSYDLIDDVDLPTKALDINETASSSETIDGTTTRIAQKFTTAAREFLQAFGVKVTGTITLTVRIETDVGGEPSGTLAHANLERTGWSPTSGSFATEVFTNGAFIDDGIYWIVFTRTAGSGTFDGGTGGTANQVKKFASGAWSNSSNVENLNIEVIRGGIASVRAQVAGAAGNIDPDSIDDVSFPGGATIGERWATNVGEFGNQDAFDGGQDEETIALYRTRVRNRLHANPECSLDGLIAAVDDGVDGVESVSGQENTDDTGSTINKVFDSNQTGTASETIDGTTTKIAQKFVTTEERFVQHANAKLASDTSLICKVRIETDTAGSPSGALANAYFEKTNFDFDGTNLSTVTFDNGAYLPAGTYWLVFERTSGSGTFDGGTGGTADQVKNNDGTWALDANVENLNSEVLGGIPPHGARIYVDGGDADAIAQELWESHSTGTTLDGVDSGTAKDRNNADQTVRFERPTIVPIYIDITITKTDDFSGDEDTIRDEIVDYIGGLDTGGTSHPGLAVDFDVIRNKLITRVLSLTGLVNITSLKLDTVDPPVATTGDIGIAVGEKAKIEDIAADVDVTLVLASGV